MVLYELRNLNGNLMPHFFGIIFPNLMCMLLPRAVASGLPEFERRLAKALSLSVCKGETRRADVSGISWEGIAERVIGTVAG